MKNRIYYRILWLTQGICFEKLKTKFYVKMIDSSIWINKVDNY